MMLNHMQNQNDRSIVTIRSKIKVKSYAMDNKYSILNANADLLGKCLLDTNGVF